MKILIIGSGGREHALTWKLAQSKHVESIYVSPGNAGTDMVDKCCNINLNTHKELLNFAKENNIDLTIVGPEKTLVEGIVDLFKKHKLNIFGPSKIAAKLEGSKIFAKNFMKEFKVKTANYKSFNNPYSALSYLKHASFPLVIKANGLAAGKGVVICNNFKTAQTTITQFMLQHSLEQAGKSIIIEEFLIGIEASIICLTDGKTMVPLISARDYKTIYENNKGPNTGGMGAISPNNYCTDKVMDDFIKNIMNPTLNGIKKSKMDFHGFVFFGIMITKNGCKCLEYNVRMGDPECQSIIPLMNFDLLEMFQMTLKNQLHKFKFIWKKQICINVVMTSKGYPKTYTKGIKINVTNKPFVFYAGTIKKGNELLTNGGRVLSIVATADNIEKARKKVYKTIKNVSFKDAFYRKDIGL